MNPSPDGDPMIARIPPAGAGASDPMLPEALDRLRRVLDETPRGDSPAVRAALLTFKGCEAVHDDRPLHVRVRLEGIRFGEGTIGLWGPILKSVGGPKPPPQSFGVTVSWEWFGYSSRRWTSGPWGGWTLSWDPQSLAAFDRSHALHLELDKYRTREEKMEHLRRWAEAERQAGRFP